MLVKVKIKIPTKIKFVLIVLILIVLGEETYLVLSQRNIQSNPSIVTQTVCKTFNSGSQKLQCWEDLIDSTLKTQGIHQTFEIVEKLYTTESVFASDCHSYVHKIGEKAYKLFSQHQNFALSPKTSYCGYGFYHAFMESLLKDGGDLNKARKFCDYVDQQMGSSIADSKGACYHGIGHGTADNHDQKYWENEKALVDPALKLCEKVAPNEVLLNRCSSGVFNVLAIAYGGNKVKINTQEPLWFCDQLSNRIYKKTCYEEMNTALFALTHNDFIQAAKFIERITEDEFANSGIRSLAGVLGMSRVQDSDFTEPIYSCHQLQARLRSSCFEGFVGGLIEGGEPGIEYVKTITLCKDSSLNKEEKRACFEAVLWFSSLYYPKEKYQSVCNMIDDGYKRNCV